MFSKLCIFELIRIVLANASAIVAIFYYRPDNWKSLSKIENLWYLLRYVVSDAVIVIALSPLSA